MRFLQKLKETKPLSVSKTVGGFWLFMDEMQRLGLWPEMTEEKKERRLEYASPVPIQDNLPDNISN
jgi:hypothetical protein